MPMTATHFYIFRHGETDLNIAGRFQGQSCNESLNQTGISQAKQLGKDLDGKKIDIVVTSPLKRALETAEIVADELDVPLVIEPDFIEGNFGVIEGKTKTELTESEKEVFAKWIVLHDNYLDIFFEKGESKRQIMNRAVDGLRRLGKRFPGKSIAISTHSAVIRLILQFVHVKQHKIPNGKPFHVIYEDGHLKFDMAEKFLLLSCCAPCSCAVIENLAQQNKDFAVVFYNPNIQPRAEYTKRRDENKRICEKYKIPFIELDYDNERWCQLIKGLENEPERGKRCSICFHMRLKRVMEYALEHGFSAVASVLGVSRFKNLTQVNDMALKASEQTGCPYIEIEGRKNGMQERRSFLIKDLNLYNQSYCGCKPR